MDKIKFPLKPRMQGLSVANLQDALKLLVERQIMLAGDEAARLEVTEALGQERANQTFGKVTSKLVALFQKARRLPVSPGVDEATAQALNTLLDKWGLFAPAPRRLATGLGRKPLDIAPNALTSKSIGEMQTALRKLKLTVQPSDLARKELGQSTKEAIRAFQERAGLRADGKLTANTLEKLNAELGHRYVADSKARTQRLQALLQRVGQQVDPAEVKSRRFGPSTEQAFKQFQASVGMAEDGRISNEAVTTLRDEALKARFSSKAQVAKMHRTLLRTLHIAKLTDVRVDDSELKSRQVGPSTQAAIKAVQQKYGLPATGELDPDTYDRLVSLAASIPQAAKQLKPKPADQLKPIKQVARLNMQGQQVNDAQGALAFLGYRINESEFKSKTFGKSTRTAIVSYQRAHGLPVTGHVEGTTLDSLNRAVQQANPQAITSEHSYRVRGSVRNELWVGMAGIKVQVWEKLINGQGALLAERPSAGNGFFDIPYNPPRDSATKQIKRPFYLQVKALDPTNQEIGSKLLFNPTPIAWANFTQGDQPYRGTSAFAARKAAVQKAIDSGSIAALVEREQDRQVSQAALKAGLAPEDVMRLVLAHLVAAKLQHPPLGPEACYAYVGQNLPPSLPGDLIESTEDWELIDQLVDLAANGLVFMESDLQALAFENAITLNLMPITVGRQKEAIVAALADLKQSFVLEKPILIGNGSLKELFDVSKVDQPHYSTLAGAFLQHKSLGPDFWADLKARPGDFGGAAAVQDLETTVNVGHIAKNFVPMLTLLKQKIDDPNVQHIQSARDLAKLTTDQYVDLINANGGQVPQSTDGASPADRVQTYAATLASQSEQMFPAVALAATIGRSTNNPLPHVASIQKLLDTHPDFNLRTTNLDVFVKEQGIELDLDTLTEARVMQRVHRIAPTAAAGQALLDQKIHNSAQIVSLGKERFADSLAATKLVDRRTALTVYGLAEYQYAQTLQHIADYRFELHRTDPRAIINHTYAPDELPAALVGIPNLEVLFGSLDYCDCPHCQSVYGPPAYLADVLRYLDSHPAETANQTVMDILFARRPDIGNIKLNCENTDTPLPYIDLVCEVLENALSAPTPNPNFSFQTTRTAAELKAFPEHVRPEAYTTLAAANYPLDVAFDLWQEEARVFLQHLEVPRWELMQAFQSGSGVSTSPSDASIAGEYWSMSTHETTIITTQENVAAKQTVYWGFDASLAKISVAEFMRRSRLSYVQLLELLYVGWINPASDPSMMVIERPNATCNTEEQDLANLTVDRLDQMHRFLRLWRHTGWAMWELDLLIRTPALGNSRIDQDTLVRLQHFKQSQQRLGLTTEHALSLYGDINTEVRLKPDEPQRKIAPLYTNLFQNPAVVSPLNPTFALPLAGGDLLSDHKATLLAAFALTEPDLVLLLAKLTTDDLTVANLTKISRYVSLARGLALPVQDLLTLEAVSAIADIFASPQVMLDFIKQVEWVTKSGFAVAELDYLLHHKADSPHGLSDGVITQHVQALREALRSNTASQPGGTIITQVAAAFALPPEQVQLLLAQLMLGGVTLATHLEDADLTARDTTGAYTIAVTPADFPDIYSAYRLVHKCALLLIRLKVATTDLQWLLTHAADFQSLDLGDLPVTGAPAVALFPAWLSLYQWLYFRGQYPEPEDISLRAIFDLASDSATPEADLKAAIAELTQWNAQDLDDLASGLQLQHGVASDYARIDTYLRLWECFKQIKRLGAGAGLMLAWAKRDDSTAQAAAAQQIRQTVKSKYDYSVWLEKVALLENVLREKKRTALVSYMIETSLRSASPKITVGGKKYANPAYWQSANDLLNYYLIDVEMSSCQLTSRIKQAISSTQMFVQRCLLGLEQPLVEVSRAEQQDTVSDNSWKQWKWMKNYRVWEANRKVFLYPENWIEPELRDDKSPFFKELEAEIQQNDLTDENAQAAFLHYLQKVHEVARLDIVGAYYELDDTDPRDNLPPDINLLHVVGRTRSHPAVYYYRRFDLNYGEWTAWEKIDLDIQSDQVIPVVYNRQLYLFWLNFIEKPQKVKKQPAAQPSTDTNVPETPNQIEIQLAWSVRKDGGWTAKRVSTQKLIHPWQRPLYSYNLKPRYKKRENLLWMDLYISQSAEFNNTRFWDAYRNTRDFVTAFAGYDETALPWHSSSFVFDGEVIDAKLKGLAGRYHVSDSSGFATDALTQTTSYHYVHDSFGQPGRAINRLSGPYEIAPRLPLPEGMHYHNTHLVNNKQSLNASRANVLEHGHTRTLLSGAKSSFELVFSQHRIAFDTAEWGQVPFFYQDNSRAFFIKPQWQQVIVGYNQTLSTYNYNFYPFYHPYTALFMRELNRSGLDGLLNRRIQIQPQDYYPGNSFNFSGYSPGSMSAPDTTAQTDIVDFERYGAYSNYNWEIFFHAPMMIACKLSANQRFEEAMNWFHYIFDPTNTDSPDVPQRYWITRPFFEQNSEAYRAQRIDVLLTNIGQHSDQLTAWKNNPFKPHLIARYRPVAYQKAIVMKYLNNLIDWGDQLFRRDTIEAINEATTLYVLAYELLGRRPVKVPNVGHADRSYNELTADSALDPFGNKRLDILMENFTGTPVRVTRTQVGAEPLPRLDVFYFCIPNNDRLLDYWNTVEDRLFKIRHCMNLQGVVRQLPLFEPPIDPALLVKAAAAGVDLSSVLADMVAAPSPYRFQRLAGKAAELCGDVKALGDKLLAALEGYDAEGVALLRSTQEVQLHQAVRAVRKQQIDEAKETLAGLEQAQRQAEERRDYYQGREFINAWEGTALTLSGASALAEIAIATGHLMAGGLKLIPDFLAGASGFGGSPHVVSEITGGDKLGDAGEAAVQTLQSIAASLDKTAGLANTMGTYTRRQEEWDQQGRLAEIDVAQVAKQIAAAQVRLAITEKELENQELQIEQSQAVDEYMRSKYTNQQLYDWHVRQVASLYFQSYQLSYDMAKRAEKSFQFEIGDPAATFVQFGYWDSLKKGLLAGERLGNDIRRMEAAFLDQDTRDLELTKHVSLAQFLPLKLMALKEAGACTVVLPEWLFDMDYPGHIRRRIKSVSVTIPAVVGPYTSVNCTLSLTNHGIRMNDTLPGAYGDALIGGDTRFYKSPAPVTAIATSHGQNDTGMFELNFHDDRFLPFEGAGAASEWQIQLPRENNQFDLSTISDVILHVRYTARASSNVNLVNAAKANVATVLPTSGIRLLVLNHEFGTAWQRFLHPDGGADQTLAFTLGLEHLPFYARGKTTINLTSFDLIVHSKETGSFDVKLKAPGAAAPPAETMAPSLTYGGRQHLAKASFAPTAPLLDAWQIQIKKAGATDFKSLLQDDIRNAYLVLGFKTS